MILRTRQRKIDFFDFFLILHSPYLPFHVFYTSLYSTTCPIKSTVVFSFSSLFYKTTTFCVSHRYVSRETKYIKSTVTIFKSNARETWHAILVSFADIYLTVMNAGNNIRRPIWCVHTAGRSDLSQSFLSVSGYVHLRYGHLPDIHNPRQC